MAQAMKKNNKNFMGQLQKFSKDAVERGALVAMNSQDYETELERFKAPRVKGLSGAQRKNADNAIKAGFSTGYNKAQAYFETL